eukprot:359321-Chlamydomonas_euryale.AAC.4
MVCASVCVRAGARRQRRRDKEGQGRREGSCARRFLPSALRCVPLSAAPEARPMRDCKGAHSVRTEGPPPTKLAPPRSGAPPNERRQNAARRPSERRRAAKQLYSARHCLCVYVYTAGAAQPRRCPFPGPSRRRADQLRASVPTPCETAATPGGGATPFPLCEEQLQLRSLSSSACGCTFFARAAAARERIAGTAGLGAARVRGRRGGEGSFLPPKGNCFPR